MRVREITERLAVTASGNLFFLNNINDFADFRACTAGSIAGSPCYLENYGLKPKRGKRNLLRL